jgi:cytochrome c biogenesis protein CcdA
MTLLILAFLGGILTIFSPCILPVLPFALSKADQPFRKSGLPLLAGMALTFALLAAIATVAGGWIVRAKYGRVAAMVPLGDLWPDVALGGLANRSPGPLYGWADR